MRLNFCNQIQLQSYFSNLCGEYCIFFVFTLCRNKSLEYILKFFSSDLSQNDQSVKYFINKTFPGHERKSYYIW